MHYYRYSCGALCSSAFESSFKYTVCPISCWVISQFFFPPIVIRNYYPPRCWKYSGIVLIWNQGGARGKIHRIRIDIPTNCKFPRQCGRRRHLNLCQKNVTSRPRTKFWLVYRTGVLEFRVLEASGSSTFFYFIRSFSDWLTSYLREKEPENFQVTWKILYIFHTQLEILWEIIFNQKFQLRALEFIENLENSTLYTSSTLNSSGVPMKIRSSVTISRSYFPIGDVTFFHITVIWPSCNLFWGEFPANNASIVDISRHWDPGSSSQRALIGRLISS